MILYISIVSLIFTILFGIVNVFISKWKYYDSKNKTNKKKLLLRYDIILVVLLLFAIVAGFYFFKQREKEIEKGYKDLYDQVMYEIGNGEYSKAIKKINEQINHIDDDQEYISFKILKGVCLFNESENKDETVEKNRKLEETITELKELQLEKEEMTESDEIYIETILGFSYLFLEDNRYDSELEEIKEYLVRVRKKDLYKEEYDIDMFLGSYYEREYDNGSSQENLNISLSYYENSIKENNEKNFIVLLNKDTREQYKMKVAYLYLKLGGVKWRENKTESVKYFKESISKFDEIISECDKNSGADIYYESIKNQGRCYCWLMLLKDKEEDYTKKAYDKFTKFLYMDEEKYDYIMQGAYIFLYLDIISEEDIDLVLKRYRRVMKQYDALSDYEKAAETRYELAYSYVILAERNESKDYYDQGKKFLKEINNIYYDYFNVKAKENIEMLNQGYDEIKRNIFG